MSEKSLWSAVIIQAITNIRFKIDGWEEDLFFIAGGRNWEWICEQLGYDARRTSKLALIAATGKNRIMKNA